MSRSRESVERLVSELAADILELDAVEALNGRASDRIAVGSADQLDYAALGFTIHNLYGIIENYCLRISKFFENDLSSVSWHRDLLHRMTLEIPGSRPALLTRDQYLLIDDLRAFRHAFRHLYGRPLDAEKLMLVQRRIPTALSAFRGAHLAYTRKLRSLVDQLRDTD